MVLVSVKMRNQISISAIIQFRNSVLRSKLTSAKRSESTVFELVFPDIKDNLTAAEKKARGLEQEKEARRKTTRKAHINKSAIMPCEHPNYIHTKRLHPAKGEIVHSR